MESACVQWSKDSRLTIMELHPGPPLSHMASGAVLGLERASKNQNHMFILVPVSQSNMSAYHDGEGHIPGFV